MTRANNTAAAGTNLYVEMEAAQAQAGALIQDAMDGAGLTRGGLAARMGCSQALVTRILRGDHDMTLRTLVHALYVCRRGVKLDWVCFDKGCVAERDVRKRNGTTAGKGGR